MYQRVQFAAGPLSHELLNEAWFAVTVLSTTAMECSMRGIPAFLCAWLDYSPYAYVEQMAKFGAGRRLDKPDEILRIPEMLGNECGPVRSGLWEPIAPEFLEQLLSGERQAIAAAV
jgi:hypothetical protein